jgi:hypothetical protein
MRPNKEYLDMISKRLEAMNPGLGAVKGDSCHEPYKMPSAMDQMGQSAIAYLERKKGGTQIQPDPLFRNLNYPG